MTVYQEIHKYLDEEFAKKKNQMPQNNKLLSKKERQMLYGHIQKLLTYYNIKLNKVYKRFNIYRFHAKYWTPSKYLFNNIQVRGSVTICAINRRYSYFCALHEIGHLVHKIREKEETHFKSPADRYLIGTLNYTLVEGTVIDEFLAWEWAFKQSLLPVTQEDIELARHCLLDYLSATITNNFNIGPTKIESFKQKILTFKRRLKKTQCFALDENNLMQFQNDTDFENWPSHKDIIPNPWSEEGARCLAFIAGGVQKIEKLNLPQLFTAFVPDIKQYNKYKRNPRKFYQTVLTSLNQNNPKDRCYAIPNKKQLQWQSQAFYTKFQQTWTNLNEEINYETK